MVNPLVEACAELVGTDRNRTAIIAPSENQRLTLGDVWDVSIDMAKALDRLGLPGGAALVANVGNHVAFVPLMLAALATGRPLVLFDGGALDQAVAVARRFGARAVITAVTSESACAGPAVPLPAGVAASIVDEADVPPIDRRAAVVKVTSGSGAVPKGVLFTEDALVQDGRHVIEAMGLRPGDINLAVIPLAHSYAIGNVVLPLLLQGTPMVLRRQFLARQMLSDIREFDATVLPGVPFHYDYLVRLEPSPSALSTLRLAISAGAPIEAPVVLRYAERFGRKIHSFYGTSETGGIAFDGSDEVMAPPTQGHPLPGTEVSLVGQPDPQTGARRVFVRGSALGLRYAETTPGGDGFVDNGFLTADLAHRDDRGRLCLAGRLSGFLNVAGRKVSPAEVEAVISTTPGVSAAVVLGVARPARGDVMVACVQGAPPGVTPETIRARCLEQLPRYKVPRSIVLLDRMPVDPRGKLDRLALQRIATDALDHGRSG